MRGFHQGKPLRTVQEAHADTVDIFESYADSCTFFNSWTGEYLKSFPLIFFMISDFLESNA